MKTIILYASKYGTTKDCATHLHDNISGSVLHDLAKPAPPLERFDHIIIGSPVYAGKFARSVRELITFKAPMLTNKRCTIFFCGMTPKLFDKVIATNIPDDLRSHATIVPVGGAFRLERMKSLQRLLLRLTGVRESINQVNVSALDRIASS